MSISFEFRDIRFERQNHFGTSMTFITLWWNRRPERFLEFALKHGSLYNLQAGRVNMTEKRQEGRGFLVLGITELQRTRIRRMVRIGADMIARMRRMVRIGTDMIARMRRMVRIGTDMIARMRRMVRIGTDHEGIIVDGQWPMTNG